MRAARYVLVTAVRNEAEHVPHTLDSVLAQTLPPAKWIIVSDGSTDATDDIVCDRARAHPLIRFIRREPDRARDFTSKVQAIRAGLGQIGELQYDYIGNLDADVSFAPPYFESLMGRFESDPLLGIAGGLIHEDIGGRWVPQVVSASLSVAGAVQMFRRQCHEQVGGYLPLPQGGEDAVAGVMARMNGWRVRTFTDLPVRHHRRGGTAGRSLLRAFRQRGQRDCLIGYHPLFAIVRSLNLMRTPPYVVGGLCYGAGFYQTVMRGEKPAVPPDYVQFLRREQLRRLLGIHPEI